MWKTLTGTRIPDILQFVADASRDGQAHIDVNPVVAHKSSAYVQELGGPVVGQGFKALIKPRSRAASCCADHSCAAAESGPSWPRKS
jgi:predicted RNase H-related nuclease YkuK (DUF458 family)